MVGIDIVEIERVAASAKNDSFLRGVFTEGELAYYESKGRRAETLAGLFCAKEAAAKALGTGIRGFRPTDIEICHTEYGAPVVKMTGGAEKLLNGRKAEVSIAHDGGRATAIVVIE